MTQFTTRATLIAASALVLAACASTPRYPTQEGVPQGTGPQAPEMPTPKYPTRPPEGDEDDPAPAAAPVGPGEVRFEQLPPAGRSAPVETAQLAPPPSTERRYEPQPEPEPDPEPYTPPPRRTETRTVTSVGGPVVAVDGKPKTYKVKSGQGLDAVARELATTRKQLAADNDLKEPYKLKPGQVLKGPASKGKAYVVQSGDTLYAIARRFGVAAAALAEENDIEVGDPIRKGQKLRLPTGYKDSGPVKKTTTVTLDPEPAPPPRPRPAPRPQPQPEPERLPPVVSPPPPIYRPPVAQPPVAQPPVAQPPAAKPPIVQSPVVSTPAPQPYKPPVKPTPQPQPMPPGPVKPGPAPLQDDKPPVYTDADYARMAAGRFDWPVRGTVLSAYGPKSGGQRNDGVDIGASAGTPVRAAADGTVVYSGGDVPGFGVTVLIQHADGWVTVYGHLQRTDVKMQQRVSKGQQIGLVGSSGEAPRPQLHFEIRFSPSARFKAKAIDPQLVLPR
jgi:murein DD-endopeptidase MepM/ murein hydrolase activator NlpD